MLIHRNVLNAALAGIDREPDTRYPTTSIEIRPDGHVASTDGHVALVAVGTEAPPDADFPSRGIPELTDLPTAIVVLGETVRGLLGAMLRRSMIPVLEYLRTGRNGDESAVLAVTDLQAPRVAHIDLRAMATFPNIGRTIPKADAAYIRVPLSVEVLEKICRATKAAYAGRPVRSRSGKLLAPIVTLCIPTDPAAQWTTTDAGGGKQPNGVLATALRLEITAPTVEIEGAAMPVRL